MESGRSVGSGDEFREGPKKGGLPLAVFLSFNDRDVHPQCPNAFNPYHKCGRYCLDKIPFGDKLLDGERSGGSSVECEKLSERKGVTPGCPNASNPFHKCADYCFEKIKREDVVKEPVKKKGVLITKDRSDVSTNCKYASNPYHKCDKFCFEGIHDSEHSKDVMKPKEQKNIQIADRVSPQCKYASNPYHVCSEYCFQEVPERGQPVNGMKVNNLKERKINFKSREITGVDPNCRNASNPFHKCTASCFQNVAERDKSDGAPIKGKKVYPRKERKADHPTKEKDMKSDNLEASNTSHIHVDSSNELTVHVGTVGSNSVFIKEEKEDAGMIEILDTQPLRIDASDLFKEWAKYCSLNAVEDNGGNNGLTGQRERN